MDRAKWIKLSDEILKHLKAIRRILKQNGIDNLSMAFFKDTNSWATHIDNDDNRWEMRITPNEVEELVDDGFKFYTKMQSAYICPARRKHSEKYSILL